MSAVVPVLHVLSIHVTALCLTVMSVNITVVLCRKNIKVLLDGVYDIKGNKL